MFPYKTSIFLNRKRKESLYLQLSKQLIELIKEHRLPPKTKLPGSRALSQLLGVHRKTVVACYDELMLQGWVESKPKQGTFVHRNLPELEQQKLSDFIGKVKNETPGFSFYKKELLQFSMSNSTKDYMEINDGISDGRLTPIDDIARTYRRITSKKNVYKHLSYGATFGNEKLRNVLVNYLNKTRGMHITKDNILITRGSQNGIYLTSQLLLAPNDAVIVGQTNYVAADLTFKNQQAQLMRVRVDMNGLDTCQIEEICKEQSIKAVYVTSHHHHPTTVTLSAERRIHLLNLAKKYRFAIIEDDYDYDFNYKHAPILPLASHDTNGNVIYIGSICKTVAPVFRVGYLIASKEFVEAAANLRRIVDRQGDALLELTFAAFIENGDLDRHIKKMLKVYKSRRDVMCALLKSELSTYFEFEIPKGGMAIWLILKKPWSWDAVAQLANVEKLQVGDWRRYDPTNSRHNGIRLGFATYTTNEIHELIARLKRAMRGLG